MRKTADVVICRMPGRHLAFVGATRLADGDLLVVFREGAGHVDPEGQILLVRSSDQGHSWSKPEVIVDTDLDDRDSSIAALPDGRVVLTYFSSKITTPWSEEHIQRWIGRPEAYPLGKNNWHAEVQRSCMRFSSDGGRTWGEEIQLSRGDPRMRKVECGVVSARIVALKDGALVMPVYGREEGVPTYGAFLFRSTDGGKTWGQLERVASDPAGETPFGEPTMVVLPDGRILCHLRTTGAKQDPGAVWQTESSDNGRTWTSPRKLPLWGYRQSLALLDNGDVLSVFGCRRFPMGVRGAVSRDGGRTWDARDEFPIRWDGAHQDLGYPAAAPLGGGRAFVAYYINTAEEPYSPFSYIGGSWIE
jgi:hypothetical protein